MANLTPEATLLWYATLFGVLCMTNGSSKEDSLSPPPDLPRSLASLERRANKESESNEGVN